MKLRKNKIWILMLAAMTVLPGFKAFAQQTLIDVKIDTADILIGEQTTLHLTITTDNERQIICPIPSDTLMTGVEVLSISKADTIFADNRMLIKQDILVTSFDSSLYLLPPFIVIDGKDTIAASNQVALKVSTVPVNADKPEEFYDIKSVWKAPFVLSDYYPWIFGILLALFLICVVGYLFKRLKNKKPIVPFKKEEPKLPPYEQAIMELNSIKNQKLWQQGLNKEYYTNITETLRRYISSRYHTNAMEMTSEEILNVIERENDTQSVYDTLKQILRLSDYVKFAKLHPLPDENDLSMMNAYLFVNQTKEVATPKPEAATTNTQSSEQNQQTLNSEEK